MTRQAVVILAVSAMIITPLVLLALQVTPEKVLARYESYAAAHPRIQVDIAYSRNGRTVAKSKLKLARGKQMRLDSVSPTFDYSISYTSEGRKEIERVQGIYDEFPVQKRPSAYESRIDDVFGNLMPIGMLTNRLQQITKDNTSQLKLSRQDGADTLTMSLATQTGEDKLAFSFDSNGRLTKVTIASSTPSRRVDMAEWVMTNYRDLTSPDGGAFALSIPTGFVSYALPDTGWPAEIGVQTSARPKATTLFVVADPRSPFASALEQSLRRIGQSVSVKVLGPQDGKLRNELHTHLFPFFALVGRDGKVLKNWMGYDSGRAREFEREIASEVRR